MNIGIWLIIFCLFWIKFIGFVIINLFEWRICLVVFFCFGLDVRFNFNVFLLFFSGYINWIIIFGVVLMLCSCEWLLKSGCENCLKCCCFIFGLILIVVISFCIVCKFDEILFFNCVCIIISLFNILLCSCCW